MTVQTFSVLEKVQILSFLIVVIVVVVAIPRQNVESTSFEALVWLCTRDVQTIMFAVGVPAMGVGILIVIHCVRHRRELLVIVAGYREF